MPHKLSESEFPEFNNYQNEVKSLLILFFSLHANSYSVNSDSDNMQQSECWSKTAGMHVSQPMNLSLFSPSSRTSKLAAFHRYIFLLNAR